VKTETSHFINTYTTCYFVSS